MAVTTFFAKLKNGLTRSTEKLTGGIAATFTRRKLDEAALEEIPGMGKTKIERYGRAILDAVAGSPEL